MRALQYRTIGSRPELVEVPDPEPGPGQVLLKVTAAGVCHSDEHIMSLPAELYSFGLPLTLGHEGAGEVVALGDGASWREDHGGSGLTDFGVTDHRGPHRVLRESHALASLETERPDPQLREDRVRAPVPDEVELDPTVREREPLASSFAIWRTGDMKRHWLIQSS